MHVNPVPGGYSNYGRYVVIEHHWDGSSYYSLYGHLSSCMLPGQEVAKGELIAVMGYTGVGINRERAHVHLELNLMLSHQFEGWHDANFKDDPNHNGIYNGINLTGMDIARLYLALRKNPSLTMPQFLEEEETFYKVTLPQSDALRAAHSLSLDGARPRQGAPGLHGKCRSIARACRYGFNQATNK